MRQRSLKARYDKLLAEEAAQPEKWWWMSFVGEEGFRGGILTRAPGFLSAVAKVNILGLSPGGEIKGVDVVSMPEEFKQYADRLLSKEDLERFMGGTRKWVEKELEEFPEVEHDHDSKR
jgi:hypothetical protein